MLPFQFGYLNKIELMNEVFILLSIYFMHLFSSYVSDEKARYQLGWYYIYLVYSVFVFNMVWIVAYLAN